MLKFLIHAGDKIHSSVSRVSQVILSILTLSTIFYNIEFVKDSFIFLGSGYYFMPDFLE